MSRPLNEIVPAVGVVKPDKRLKNVVFPAPLGPMIAWIVPSSIARETSSTARKPANDFVRFFVSTTAAVVGYSLGRGRSAPVRYSLTHSAVVSRLRPLRTIRKRFRCAAL